MVWHLVQRHFLSNEARARDWRMTLDDFSAVGVCALRADAPPTWDHSDDDMNMRARMIPEGVQPKAAAVLVGVLDHAEGPRLLLTQRKATLSTHAGQIAFPGGRLDGDETPLQAALREAEEETGLDRRFVTPLGYLDGYLTITSYFVVPVVARIAEGFKFVPQTDEVDDIFDVPLAFLLNATNRKTEMRVVRGVERRYYVYPFGERHIWGATAGIIKNLSDRVLHAQG
jgi:8-oxo-dGTP pyrophosphatase MutT (NUDIX family)